MFNGGHETKANANIEPLETKARNSEYPVTILADGRNQRNTTPPAVIPIDVDIKLAVPEKKYDF